MHKCVQANNPAKINGFNELPGLASYITIATGKRFNLKIQKQNTVNHVVNTCM